MAERLPTPLRRLCALATFACCLPMAFHVGLPLLALFATLAGVGLLLPRQPPAALRALLVVIAGAMVLVNYRFGLGRDTASAALVAMLLLKLLETHSPRDARALVGFSLFAPFAAFLQDQGPLMLALAVPAACSVLMAMAALAEGEASLSIPRRLRQVSAMVLLALPLGLTAFWLFPRLSTPLWGLPGKSLQGGGLGNRMNPNDWIDRLTDDRTAFRVRFLGREPARAQMYWRGPVLWDFDGETWSRGDFDQFLPAPATRVEGPIFRYELMLEPTERTYLPTLDLPANAPEGSRLGAELSAYRRNPVQNLLVYSGESAPQLRIIEELPETLRRRALGLPPGRNPRALALARQWRSESTDTGALVQRILEWVRSDFTYTLSAPPLGRDSVDDFLFGTREGYCQHFSSSFVVLMRAAGVPARVVTGYAGGYRNPYGGYWSVYGRDAHAWAEIWIDGRGWVRVDPTAAVAPDNILDTQSELQAGQGLLAAAGQGINQIFDLGDFLKRGWNEFVLGFDAVRQQGLLRPIGIDQATQWQLLVALGVGAGLALGLTLLALLREARDADPVERAWRGFVRRMARQGLGKQPEEPALSYGLRLARALPSLEADLLSLSQRYARRRYAPGPSDPAEDERLRRDLSGFRPRPVPRHRTAES